MKNRNGLQIVKKTFNGIDVGYVVGWWFTTRYYWGAERDNDRSFRSFRNGVIFKTQAKAEAFRDKVEGWRKNSGVKFEEVGS
jgi:hypothetical protein